MKTVHTTSGRMTGSRSDSARLTRPLRRAFALFVLAALLAQTGCASRKSRMRRPPVPKGPIVADVVIEGNQAYSDREIMQALATEETSRVLFWEKKYLNVGEVDRDRERLLTFYQSRGYFDAIASPVRVVPYSRDKEDRENGDGANGKPDAAPLGLDQPVPGPRLELEGQRVPGLELQHDPLKQPSAGAGAPPAGVSPTAAPGVGSGGSGQTGGAQGAAGTPVTDGTATGTATPGQPGAAGGTATPGQPGAAADPNAAGGPAPAEVDEEELKRARIIFQDYDGPRYKVGELRLDVDGELPPALYELLQSRLQLGPNEYFSLDVQRADESAMLQVMREASYAWATVTTEVVVIPRGNLVRLRYHVTPGVPCVFGHLQIEGLDEVREQIIIDRAERFVVAGRPYNQEALANLQGQLYDLQLFQTVLVLPTEDSRGKPQVNVLVRVSERPFRLARAGGGFTQESEWQEVYANAGWTHNYFARRLLRYNAFAQVGWAFSPNLASSDAYQTFDPDTMDPSEIDGRNGAIADLRTGFTLPDFKARQVNVDAEARFLVGQTRTYGYLSPQFRFSVSRPVLEHLNVRVGLGVEQYLPYWDELSREVFREGDVTVVTPGGAEEDGAIQFRGLLTFLEQSATYDKRDNVLAPQRGFFAALNLQEAGLLGNFSFIKAQPDVRGYYPAVPDRLIIAARLQTGVIVPYRGTLTDAGAFGAPPVLQFETGGGSTVRGFGRDTITWYEGTNCATALPYRTEECNVETGGTILYLANLELRVPFGAFAVVGFADAGQIKYEYDNVLGSWADFNPSELQIGVGGGLRYRTLIGPIRLDFGYRVKSDEHLERGLQVFGGGCRCSIHLGIGEAF